jgi:hypothetical protein
VTFRRDRRLSPAIVVALLVLFTGLGSTSYAAVGVRARGTRSAAGMRVRTRSRALHGAFGGSVRAWKGIPRHRSAELRRPAAEAAAHRWHALMAAHWLSQRAAQVEFWRLMLYGCWLVYPCESVGWGWLP